jgi:hypothetical protein
MKRLSALAAAFALAATAVVAATAAPVTTGYSGFGGTTFSNGQATLVSNATTPFSGISFGVASGTTVSDLQSLSAVLVSAQCGGGSPRFQVRTAEGTIFVYLGTAPSFTTCSAGDTGNLLASGDLRVDTSQVGGTFYDTWANALALVGDELVTSLSFVADSGWAIAGGQTVVVDSITINGVVYDFGPQSAEDCKDGGWEAGGFKNQGDCVSFFATGGKNEAAGS